VRKASEKIAVDTALSAMPAYPYVSRGGVKLAAALGHFKFDPNGHICLDVGASTGGFTQVLLERRAKRVYAVDVGHGQLHESLRARPEIVSLEQTDIRTLAADRLDELPDFVTVDVSFISLKLALPPALALAKVPAQLIALIKPQFEAGPKEVGKGGVVRDEAKRRAALESVADAARALGFEVLGHAESPLEGPAGNREWLLVLRAPGA